MQMLVSAFGFNLPPDGVDGSSTPPSTAAVRGLIAGAPRRVHHLSAVVLAALTGRSHIPQLAPTLISSYDFTDDGAAEILERHRPAPIKPDDVIARGGVTHLRKLLESPLCYRTNGRSHGTLKALANWCAQRRADLRVHFAKTGTQVNEDPDETVDVWATGGLQFTNGAAYSYVVLVGTGTPTQPFARSLHASDIAAPLLAVLLSDLADHAKANPVVAANTRAPRRPGTSTVGEPGHTNHVTPTRAVANVRRARRDPDWVSDLFEQLGAR